MDEAMTPERAQKIREGYLADLPFQQEVTQHMIQDRRLAKATFTDKLLDIPKGATEGFINAGISATNLVGDLAGSQELPEISGQYSATSGSLVGNMSSSIAQFATTYLATYGLGGVGAAAELGAGGRVALGLGRGAVADFVGFSGQGGRLSDLVEAHPVLSNPITRFLSSKPDDNWAERRLKNALEGLGLGATSELLLHSLRGIRAENALAEAKAPELRAYLEKQIADSHQKLGDAIGAMESGEGAARASRMMDVLHQDATEADARQAAIDARRSGTLEDSTPSPIHEGDTIENAPPPPPMSIDGAFEQKKVVSPGVAMEEPPAPNLGQPSVVRRKPYIGSDTMPNSEPILQGGTYKGPVPESVMPSGSSGTEITGPNTPTGPTGETIDLTTPGKQYRTMADRYDVYHPNGDVSTVGQPSPFPKSDNLTPPDAPHVKFTEGHNANNVLC